MELHAEVMTDVQSAPNSQALRDQLNIKMYEALKGVLGVSSTSYYLFRTTKNRDLVRIVAMKNSEITGETLYISQRAMDYGIKRDAMENGYNVWKNGELVRGYEPWQALCATRIFMAIDMHILQEKLSFDAEQFNRIKLIWILSEICNEGLYISEDQARKNYQILIDLLEPSRQNELETSVEKMLENINANRRLSDILTRTFTAASGAVAITGVTLLVLFLLGVAMQHALAPCLLMTALGIAFTALGMMQLLFGKPHYARAFQDNFNVAAATGDGSLKITNYKTILFSTTPETQGVIVEQAEQIIDECKR